MSARVHSHCRLIPFGLTTVVAAAAWLLTFFEHSKKLKKERIRRAEEFVPANSHNNGENGWRGIESEGRGE